MAYSRANFVCMHCGFQLRDISTWWIRKQSSVICPACQLTNGWKKVSLVSVPQEVKRALEDETWKKLLIAQNPRKYHRGYFKLSKNWKKFYNWLDDLAVEHPQEAQYIRRAFT